MRARYVMYFWEGSFKARDAHVPTCLLCLLGFHRPIGVGVELEPRRQHLFSRREGLPLFHLHSRLLSLPLLPALYTRFTSFSKALVDWPLPIQKSSFDPQPFLIFFLPSSALINRVGDNDNCTSIFSFLISDPPLNGTQLEHQHLVPKSTSECK